MSIAGGYHLAFERAKAVAATAVQVFTKSDRQWRAKPISDGEAAAFRKGRGDAGVTSAFAHDSYLINLATANSAMRRKSLEAFVHELERCEALGLDFLVTHPGAPGEAGEEMGVILMAKSLDEAHRRTRGFRAQIVLETTAGQGTVLGWRFEQLRAIRDRLREPERIGVCVDTCHVFCAGYDIATKEGWDRVFDEFDRQLGIGTIRAFHVNDSKKGLGCRVDRHEHIGKGSLGIEPFRFLMNDPRFRAVPKVLETPKEGGMDCVNLELLRSLVK